MDIATLLKLCHAYSRLGDAIGDQVHAVIDGEPVAEQNASALRIARRVFIDEARHYGVDVSAWDDALDASEKAG